MTSRQASLRKAAVLGVLALALGLVAVRGVAKREAAVEERIGPVVRVVVLGRDVPGGQSLTASDLAYREMPLRWVAPRTIGEADEAVGLQTTVALERGTPLMGSLVSSPGDQARDALASGDRVLELVAVGSEALVRPGTRVDVVRSGQKADGTRHTNVVAEGVEVIAVREADEPSPDGARQVSVTVRVALDAAVSLTAAQDGDASLRLLPRAAWDRRKLLQAP